MNYKVLNGSDKIDIFQLNEKVASSTGFSEKVANLAVSDKSGDVNIFEWKISERALFEWKSSKIDSLESKNGKLDSFKWEWQSWHFSNKKVASSPLLNGKVASSTVSNQEVTN